MKILIAPDSFKDALAAKEVAAAMAEGLQMALPQAELVLCPLADGGEHTLEVWCAHLGGRLAYFEVSGPLGEAVRAPVALSGDGETVMIEMARVAGLELVPPERRNPLHTTTFGVGELIGAAARLDARRLVLTIGGSATHDVGAGMAAALGWRFFDVEGQSFVPVGATLHRVAAIRPPDRALPFEEVLVLCDVRNPLLGPEGAAWTYAAQKGANVQDQELLEAGTRRFVALLEQATGRSLADLPGAGAAGGMGAGAVAFLGARLVPGAAYLLDAIAFDEKLRGADWVITGEGRFDGQTGHGKLVAEVAVRARAHGVKVMVLCGTLDATAAALDELGIRAAFSIVQGPCTLEEALRRTREWLCLTAWSAGRMIQADSSTGNSSK